jgi:glycosyltransferase involved in cell wall biosynthesis/2-polyprenyl-3-methyl-5-hydroxy-6-metoxy-1,4-benzoquinol methylase
MFIAIHCGGMPFNGASIANGESLGGSESAAYFMALELRRLGHDVTVFTNSEQSGKYDDVKYEWCGKLTPQAPLGERFNIVMRVPHDVCIVQRHPGAFMQHLNSKLNIWWLHDLALYRMAKMVHHNMVHIDQVLAVSKFHKEQVAKVYDIPKDLITATTNGVDYSYFPTTRSLEDREPRSLVFAARPERGLKELVAPGGLMEKLTNCKLYVCTYKNVPAHMKGLYDFLWRRCDELPNVKNVGFLGKSDLYDLIGRCALYVYPTTFEDTSCIMVLEANAAGTPFIGCENAAQPETAIGGGAALLKLKDGKVDLSKFERKINQALGDTEYWQNLHEKALTKQQTWKAAAEQWQALFYQLLEKRCANKTRLYKHLERMSDIVPICRAEGRAKIIETYLPDFRHNYNFYLTHEFEKHYDAYYEYEKNRGVNYGPEDLTGNARFEHTAAKVAELKPKSILDYGCAHGHYVMNLKKRFHAEEIQYFGLDINQLNIDIANKWKDKDLGFHKKDVFFLKNTIDSFQRGFPPDKDKFDLILLGEILEHVADPIELCEKLKQQLTPDGHILITVPYGPWEAIGYFEHKGWRAHIHHFERRDIWDIFGTQKNFNLQGIPHGSDIGHYMITFQNSEQAFGKFDYSYKLKMQAPRETVSVCMIARDAELEIGKTLKSIEQVADEIIVGIDENTKDATETIAQRFGARTFIMPSPLREDTGFDRARNLTIEKATMDWIFWIDSDEQLQQLENLPKYLRPNAFDGYGIKQHHFAVEPPGIMKTDFPARLFRNSKGITFFGHVHEHPEKGFNEGIGKVYIIPDVSIMHMGYATERIRRRRFERNFPLMQIEHKRHPERTLGVFLWLRDLAHACRYTMERNGLMVTDDVMRWAAEGIETWRKLLKTEHSRMIVEAMPFYSECVQIVHNGNGVEFGFNFVSAKGHSAPDLPPEAVVKGLFANNDDIKALVSHLINQNLEIYSEKYF